MYTVRTMQSSLLDVAFRKCAAKKAWVWVLCKCACWCLLQVLQAMDRYYNLFNSNVHRGVHHLSNLATEAYEEARRKVLQWTTHKSVLQHAVSCNMKSDVDSSYP